MNAVLSAQTLDWRSSVAYKPEVQVAVRPQKVYEFNARAILDPGFRDRLRTDSATTLQDCGFERIRATPQNGRLAALQITDAELKVVSELAEHVATHGVRGNIVLESELTELGYGMPVFLFVIVGLFIFVFFF
jgi:hypothetical protein